MSRVNTKNAFDPTPALVGAEIVIFSRNPTTYLSRPVVAGHKTAFLSKIKLCILMSREDTKNALDPTSTLVGTELVIFQEIQTPIHPDK